MNKVRAILAATSLPGPVLVVLTPTDRFDVDAECRRTAPGAEPIAEANGAPIITAVVDKSCVLHADLTVHVLAF